MIQNNIKYLFILCFLILLPACSTLPERQPVKATYAQQRDTSNTYLAKLFQPLKQQHENLTGYHILYEPTEALATRLQLIERAEKTLDLQYYIYANYG